MSLIGTLTTGVSGVHCQCQRTEHHWGQHCQRQYHWIQKQPGCFRRSVQHIAGRGHPDFDQVGQGTQLLGSLQSFEQGAFENSAPTLWTSLSTARDFSSSTTAPVTFTPAPGSSRVNENGLVQNITGELLQGFRNHQQCRRAPR